MYLVRVNQSCVCERNSHQAGGWVLYRPTQHAPEERGEGVGAREFLLKYVQIVHFMHFSTIFTALFSPFIAHERTAQNLILSVGSSLFALFLIERHRSQNQGSLESKERLSDFKERCAQL